MDYFWDFVSFFKENPELEIIIRPHPLMFSHFLSRGVLSVSEYQNIINTIEGQGNMSLDVSADYLNSFEKADVLISDLSSLIVEFFITGKPIIYCGETTAFCPECQRMAEGFYIADDFATVRDSILSLHHDNDSLRENRKKIVFDVFKKSGSIGHDIADSIIEMVKK